MPNVFIVNQAGFPYEPAVEFGELVYMSRGLIDIKQDFQTYKSRFRELVATSTPDDFLLLTGPVLLCAEAVKLWLDKHKMCRVLQWEQKARRYIPYDL